jgi:hypothetical protein
MESCSPTLVALGLFLLGLVFHAIENRYNSLLEEVRLKTGDR